MLYLCSLIEEITESAVTQSATAGTHNTAFAGYGLCALELIIVLFFIVKVLQASDTEMKYARARSSKRTKFVPKPGAYENVTTVTSNTVTESDVNYTPFTGHTDYETETVTVYDNPESSVYTPFTERATYGKPDNGTVFDIAQEKGSFISIAGADEPKQYGEEAHSISEVGEIIPDRAGQALWQTEETETTTDDIFTQIGEGEVVPAIDTGDEKMTTTAPSIFDVIGDKNKSKKQ